MRINPPVVGCDKFLMFGAVLMPPPGKQPHTRNIIAVVGPPNTGKTTAIRKFVEGPGIRLKRVGPGEIKLVVRLKRSGTWVWVGVASRGDSVADVKAVVQDFTSLNCDVIVCAARSGSVQQALEIAATKNGWRFNIVATSKITTTPGGSTAISQQTIDAQATVVAQQIRSSI